MKLSIPTALCALLAASCSSGSASAPPVRSLEAYLPLDVVRIWTFTEGRQIRNAVGVVWPAVVMFPPPPSTFLTVDDESFVMWSALREWATSGARRVPDAPLVLLEDPLVPGTELTADEGYTDWLPLSTTKLDEGRIQARSRIDGPVRVTVPAGTFDDVLLWELEFAWVDGKGVPGLRRWRFWLARDVGPVQLQLDDGPIHGLVERAEE